MLTLFFIYLVGCVVTHRFKEILKGDRSATHRFKEILKGDRSPFLCAEPVNLIRCVTTHPTGL
ncbi:MAG TPA: hypothetical protein V6D16_10005 [Candidatus Obscuribacterales bacterium]